MRINKNYILRIPNYLKYLISRFFPFRRRYQRNKFPNNFHNQFLVDKLTQDILNKGFCAFEMNDFLSNSQINTIFKSVDSYVNKEDKVYDKTFLKNYIGGEFRSGESLFLKLEDSFFQYALNQTLLSIVFKYFNGDCNIVDIQLAKTISDKNANRDREFSQRWHRDPSTRGVLKIFTYFSDVKKENGPFEFIQATHNQNNLSPIDGPKSTKLFGGSFYPNKDIISNYLKNKSEKIKSFTGKKGSVIIADTSGLHRGGFAKKGYRLMSTFTYYPLNSAINSRIKLYRKEKSKLNDFQRYFLN